MIKYKTELFVLGRNTWKHLTVSKQVIANSLPTKNSLYLQIIYIYMYKVDLALNNHQGLIYH